MSRFIICRASAGSGKTYTLVRQFIEISISSPSQLEHRFGQILAITFTNKAANGMKSRIMSRLKHIVNGDNDAKDLVDEIATHLGITKQEVVRRCSVLQSAILHHYSELSVCTIDSFVLRVVRTFAHDLRLPMGFSVMLDQSELLQNAVDELMSLAGRDDQLPLTHVLCAYVENSMEDGHSFDVSGSIVKLSEQILKEETPEFLNQLKHIDFDGFIRIFRQLRHDNQQSEKDIAAEAKRFVDACSKKGIVASDFPGKSNGVLSWIQQLADGKFEKANKPYKSVETAFAASSLLGDGKLPAKSVALEELVPLFMEVYVSILQMCRQYNTRQMLMSNLFGMALLNRVNQIIDSLYAENEQVHISE